MTILPLLTLAGVVVTVALVAGAQIANPEQSAVSMGMSGLVSGRHGWVMRLAFIVRGLTAFALVGAVWVSAPEDARSVAGLLQRVYLALVMLWTAVVAIGL